MIIAQLRMLSAPPPPPSTHTSSAKVQLSYVSLPSLVRLIEGLIEHYDNHG